MTNRKTKIINEEIINDISFFQTNKTLVASVVLAVLCLLIYAQTFGFDFINIDDRAYIYENRAVINGLYSKTVYWAFTAFYAGNWHPLTWISHILDFTLFGLNPNAFHAVNVFFHIVNSILTLLVFHKLTGDFVKSSIVAALFAVHPAHVESVAWIAERKDVLSTMFWLLTMLTYFRWNEKGSKLTSPYYFAFIGFFALGLMSKSMLVTLPFVLLLCDYWALERWKMYDWKCLKLLVAEKIPLFLLTIASIIITILSQKSAGAVATRLKQFRLNLV
jgi:protein O-mannosyl-transferase